MTDHLYEPDDAECGDDLTAVDRADGSNDQSEPAYEEVAP